MKSLPCTSTSILPPRPLNASMAFFTITSSAHSISTGSPVALCGNALAHRPDRKQHETEEHRALESRETGERAGRGERAVVDHAHAGLNQRRVHLVQLGDPGAPRRVARGCVERLIVERGDAAGCI